MSDKQNKGGAAAASGDNKPAEEKKKDDKALAEEELVSKGSHTSTLALIIDLSNPSYLLTERRRPVAQREARVVG